MRGKDKGAAPSGPTGWSWIMGHQRPGSFRMEDRGDGVWGLLLSPTPHSHQDTPGLPGEPRWWWTPRLRRGSGDPQKVHPQTSALLWVGLVRRLGAVRGAAHETGLEGKRLIEHPLCPSPSNVVTDLSGPCPWRLELGVGARAAGASQADTVGVEHQRASRLLEAQPGPRTLLPPDPGEMPHHREDLTSRAALRAQMNVCGSAPKV